MDRPRQVVSRRMVLASRGAGLAMVLALGCGSVSAAPARMSASSAKAVGFQGIWLGTQSSDWVDAKYRTKAAWAPNPASMFTPWGVEESKRLATALTPGECDPFNPAEMVTGLSLWPILISQAGDQLLITVETPVQLPRRIFMDGRPHPDNLDPTWEGHSTAHWEGDTLVVDTIGVNGLSRPLNGYVAGTVTAVQGDYAPRLPLTDKMHLVERMRLVGDGRFLEDRLTITDPKAYTGPFSKVSYYERRPDLPFLEFFCTENQRPESEGQHDAAASGAAVKTVR